MELNELFSRLKHYGNFVAKDILMRQNNSLKNINKAMSGFVEEYAMKDSQGLTQISSMLGHPRPTNIMLSLKSKAFNVELFNKKGVPPKDQCDLLLENIESEVRGSLSHHYNSYGDPRGGKKNRVHSKRPYFILKEKINLLVCEIVSIEFQVLYISSSKFKKTKSEKTNMTIMDNVEIDEIVYKTEVFNEKRDNQTRLF